MIELVETFWGQEPDNVLVFTADEPHGHHFIRPIGGGTMTDKTGWTANTPGHVHEVDEHWPSGPAILIGRTHYHKVACAIDNTDT